MAKAVADTTGENQGGFASDSSYIIVGTLWIWGSWPKPRHITDLPVNLLQGFSHMHDSGTGGVRRSVEF